MIGHTAAVVQVLFDPAGRFLATRSEDRTIRLWDTRTGDHRVIAEISQQSFDDWVRLGIGAFSRDGSRLACVLGNTCVVVHTQSGEIVSTFDGHAWPIDNTAFGLDGSRVFTASTDNTIRVWETDTGREVLVLRPETSHEDGFDIFELSPDGTRLVARYAFDTTIHIFDTVPFRERLKPSP
ncbi:MAG: hypothetical protein KF705_13375 [Phycisphaeraceae bacterium]|nr:hypothetical protein [Phycisphaeraceae bacterium]